MADEPDILEVTGPLPEPPRLNVADAVRTLLEAVERAGPRWRFHDRKEIRGVDIDDATEIWPVRVASDALLGLVVQCEGDPHPDDQLIRVLVGALNSLVEAEQAAAEAERRAVEAEEAARLDPLTGLANRRSWREVLVAEGARLRRHDRRAVVAVVDLDDLKRVNDEHGHLAGDVLLKRAATTLVDAVRDSDVVARLGGDEFAVLAVESDPGAADQVATRIRCALAAAGIRASVGSASADRSHPLPEALEAADRAMYAEKALRRIGPGGPEPVPQSCTTGDA